MGVCLISNAYYHDALSPQLASTATYSVYDVVDPMTAAAEDLLWTEPYWSVSIGATSFLKDADSTGIATLVVGLFFTAATGYGMWHLVKWLDTYFLVP
jgi:hypothetical protein